MISNEDLGNRVLNLYPIDYPFETLVERAAKGKLNLSPEFQRKYKWSDFKAARFIESSIMRIPLPTCYLAEDDDKNHLVIDGVQRITSIKRFFNNEFPLEELSVFTEYNGFYYKDLPVTIRNDIENYTIRCIILRKENKRDLIQDIFARLNQGAVSLTPQEIRHALYPGPLDSLLKELSAVPVIKDFGIGKSGKRKKDGLEAEEMVLRFFAMRGDLADYDDNFTKYLDNSWVIA